MMKPCRTGTAAWALPRDSRTHFPEGDSNLARYACRLNATEINSSFYRPHRAEVFARWAAAVPESFRFSVKLPKTISHEARLVKTEPLLDEFLAQAAGLGSKLGCLLVQLPPSLAFDAQVAQRFVSALRERHNGAVAMEPRHASWFAPEADALLQASRISRVLADPVLHEPGRWPGGSQDVVYCRLHGSPRTYYSSYEAPVLRALAARIRLAQQSGSETWIIFDNTASGAATANALALDSFLIAPATTPGAA